MSTPHRADSETRREEIRAALAGRSTEQIIAAIDAGHTMAQMPLTNDDKAAIARVDRGDTTLEQERDRMLAEFAAQRAAAHPDSPRQQ
ncbi:hypothetical protein [Gordonia sp. N1V]|uniref:hypothetical protein n=1 Tax=Gordonia sp. N1V TaxID=3034163 RepID=UPI0023E2E0DB|nr:hypothetical protein [Gordonia sp. N1V]MDF3285014.1 hypothetical protein [Gordonia sp. N1V]